MKTQSAKAKGRRLQQEVASSLAKRYDLTYGQDEDFSSRGMGQSGVDIAMSPLAKSMCPFDIEAKCQETWSIPEWWRQTIANTKEGRIPLLVIKKNRHETLAILRFEDLLRLMP